MSLRPAAPIVASGLVAAALALAAPLALAETYKWTDDKGVVHYTDKMPAEDVNKAATVLDKQARPVKHIDPPLTPEQRAARDAEEKKKQALAKSQEEAERQDRALMQSFTSVEEIELSKKRALATIDGQIQSSHAYVEQLGKRKDEIETRKAALGNKPVPDAMEREIASIDAEVARQGDLLHQREQERAATASRYDGLIVRWNALKAQQDAKAAAAAAAAVPAKAPAPAKSATAH
jgi:DNA repair exonuclease SbcCD ATPase subunit